MLKAGTRVNTQNATGTIKDCFYAKHLKKYLYAVAIEGVTSETLNAKYSLWDEVISINEDKVLSNVVLEFIKNGWQPVYEDELQQVVEDGLVIMRGQPFHLGHIRLIDTALYHSNFVYLILGSIQEYGTDRNPFPFSQRKQMIKNYYINNIDKWSKLIIIGLPDIFSLRWPTYVLEQIHGEYSPTQDFLAYKSYDTTNITTVFGGTQYDCDWFKNLKHHVVGRADTEHPYVSATMIREMLTYKDPRWKEYIPKCNWEIVAKYFKE